MSSPIFSTISSLFSDTRFSSSPNPSGPSFDSSNLTLIRDGAPAPPGKVKGHIKALVEAAEEAATSLACGSILVGLGSESDDNGDVGLWLGDGPYAHGQENEVLKALDLMGWAQGEEIVAVELQPPDYLPSILPASVDLKSNKTMAMFAKLLSSFEQKHCFRVKKGGSGSGGLVAFFLLGKLSEGWGGLVGLGVWADE